MTQERERGRLVVLVADRDIEEALAELFRRPESLGFGSLRFEIRRYPSRDAGCYTDAANFLRQFLRACRYALVVFDRRGSGATPSRRSAPPSSRRRRSAGLFGEIAAGVSLEGCQDSAFLKLRRILQEWFPKAEP